MTALTAWDNLIFDLGMNNGDDTEYYLKRGFRVVGVEANPNLCQSSQKRFEAPIATGQLAIVNAAIWASSGEETFYINLQNDHWSSLDVDWASRENSHFKKIKVRCVTLPELFSEFGVPHFLKIDVEGVDHIVLSQLHGLPQLPDYVSVEDCRFGYDYMQTLAECGYDAFKLFDQSKVEGMRDESVDHEFRAGSSGPFGEDVGGTWKSFADIVEYYSVTVRDRDGKRLAPRTQWWDIHCKRI